MAEGSRLESDRAREGAAGSNPSLTANRSSDDDTTGCEAMP